MDEFWLFLGRFHPMVLHMPIGIISVAVFFEVLSFKIEKEKIRPGISILIILGTLSAIAATLLGLMLGSSDEYSGNSYWWHRTLGIATSVGMVIVWILHSKWQSSEDSHRIGLAYRFVLVLTMGCLMYGGHMGANLTHGEDWLFEYWPAWLPGKPPKEVVEVSEDEQMNFYLKEIQPILKTACFKCHGPEKQKHNLRFDKAEWEKDGKTIRLFDVKPGDMPYIKPGDPFNSSVVTTMMLPKSHDDVMPPEDETARPTPEEILKVVHWVQNGAWFPGPDNKNAAAAATATAKPAEKTGDAPAETPAEKPDEAPAKTAATTGGMYATKIVPIMEKYCISCHGPKKPDSPTKKGPKGDLRLDTYEWIMKGVEDGDKVVIPGKPDESSFYKLTTLPEDHEDVMPSKGDLLTKEEQETLRDWIAKGAKPE